MKFHGVALMSSVSRPSGPYRALFSKTHSSISGQPYRFPNCSQEQKPCPNTKIILCWESGFPVCFLCEHYSPDIIKTHTLSSFKSQPIDIFCLFCSSSLFYFNFSIPFQTNIPMLILLKPLFFPSHTPILFFLLSLWFIFCLQNVTTQVRKTSLFHLLLYSKVWKGS